MAFNLQAERERRNALAKDTRNILDQNPGATWNDEHQKKYDENLAEIERIDAAIERHQKVMDLTAENNLRDAVSDVTKGDKATKDEAVRLFDKWCRGGETMNFPTSAGTSEEGEIVGQNTAAADLDISFGTKSLVVYKYSSKVVTVPWELLQDSSADIEGFVRNRLQQRLGRITNKHFTVGTGSSQPNGLIPSATVGVTGAVSATAAITYDNLVDLEHSVDPAYRANAKWMFHDDMLKLIRKVKDTEGRPIFVPGYEQGNPGGAPDRLLNRNIAINQAVASPAASAVSIAFGDFSYYKIRDVMSVTLFRFTDSAYTKKGQVGFLAWMRSGGNLVDVGGAVKTFKHGAAA